jgi:hypothetical protein
MSISIDARARALMHGHYSHIKNRQQSLLDRTAAEAGIPMDAASHWSHIQGKPSHDISASCDRSSASMS